MEGLVRSACQPCVTTRQSRDATVDRFRIEQREARHRRAHSRIQIRRRAAPEGGQKAVGTVVRNGDAIDPAVAETRHDVVDRWLLRTHESRHLGEIGFNQPEVFELARLEREDDEPASYASHLEEPTAPVGPVMQRERCESSVEGGGAERQRLG